jgi:hypothetical protein
MRLSEWRTGAPHKDSLTPKVVAVLEPVLAAMGAEPDPSCWIAWGDDPAVRYSILAPTAPGLIVVHVRVNVPQEGPRAGGKLIRWSRVQIGELAIEMAGGHRLLSFQVEGQVLRGSDDDADAISAFALELIAAIDGRPFTPPTTGRERLRAGAGKPTAATKTPGRRAGSGSAVPQLAPPREAAS